MNLIHFFQVTVTGSSVINKAGRNAVVTSLMVCCGFIVCCSPNHTVVLISFSGVTADFGSWYYHVTAVMMFTNCFINPFIYAAKYREFQKGVRRLMMALNLRQQQTQVSAVT